MISLLLTLFISLLSIGSSINSIDDPKESNIVLQDSKPIQNTMKYDGHTGYTSNISELGCLEVWENLEIVFGNVWSEFTNDYGDFSHNYEDRNSNLGGNVFIGFHPFYLYANSYDSMLSWLNDNYSGFKVTGYKLYNRRFSSWSTDSNVNAWDYYEHYIDFYLANGFIYSIDMYKDDGTFFVKGIYRVGDNVYTNEYMHSGIFIGDECTFKPIFYTTNNYEVQQDKDDYYREGYQAGYDSGVQTGITAGETTGYGEGYQAGYNEGLQNADYDNTAMTIFSGIMGIALVPINMFLNIFNFEILGINLAGLISGILTVAVVVIIIRVIVGGKNND